MASVYIPVDSPVLYIPNSGRAWWLVAIFQKGLYMDTENRRRVPIRPKMTAVELMRSMSPAQGDAFMDTFRTFTPNLERFASFSGDDGQRVDQYTIIVRQESELESLIIALRDDPNALPYLRLA